jgi:hypothetical protein
MQTAMKMAPMRRMLFILGLARAGAKCSFRLPIRAARD